MRETRRDPTTGQWTIHCNHQMPGVGAIWMAPALHSGGLPDDAAPMLGNGGSAYGFVVDDGKTKVYHAGDTVWYEGLQTKLRRWRFDAMLVPINGRDANRLRTWVRNADCVGAGMDEAAGSVEGSVLRNAPHTARSTIVGEWEHSYTREQAVYPLPGVMRNKYWPPVRRIDNAYGDRNLVCTCPPVDAYGG